MNTLRFEKIEIERVPGVTRENRFRIEDLSKDINLVFGPNGSGKSITGQSLLSLIWPAATNQSRPTMSGTWSLDGSRWDVELDAGHATWHRDGVSSEPPSLPSSESKAQHWLGLRELLGDDGPDGADTTMFARRIARELLGGFDLDAAGDELDYTARPSRPRKLRGDLDRARQDLGHASTIEHELHDRSLRLESLRAERERSGQADEESRRLQRALEHRDACGVVLELESRLGGFDDVVQKLKGDERDRIDELRSRLATAAAELEIADRTVTESKNARDLTGLPDDGVPKNLIRTAGEDVVAIQRAHQGVEQGVAALEQAEAELRGFAHSVAPECGGEILESLGSVPLEQMTRLARTLPAFREDAARVQARQRELAENAARLEAEAGVLDDRSSDQLRRGYEVLSQWLAAPANATVESRSWDLRVLVAAGLVGALFVVLAILGHWSWSVGLLAAAVLAWSGRPRNAAARTGDARATYEAEYRQGGLAEPGGWTADAVGATLRELIEASTTRRFHEDEKRRHELVRSQVLEQERELAAKERQVDELRASIEATLDFEITADQADWLHVLGSNLQHWQEKKSQVDGLAAKLVVLKAQLQESIASFNARIQRFVDESAQNAAEAAGALESLRDRVAARREAEVEIRRGEEDRERARARIEEAAGEIRALFETLGLDPEAEHRIDESLGRRVEYRECERAIDRARDRQVDLASEVGEEHPALGLDRIQLEVDRDRAMLEAGRLSDLDQEIGAITREVERAKSGHSVEQAQREVDRATMAMVEELRRSEQKVAGHSVVQWLKEEASERNQPAILRYASELFRRITHGRYELRVEDRDDGPTFFGWDTRDELQKSLHQLSGGERVQLLLAVRLGFLEHGESGIRLPLLLDETLGTTDDERAGAIIDTVVEVCRSGRQVFYFTAQPDEIGKWLGRLEGVEDLGHATVDLARIRGMAEADNSPLVIERPVVNSVPDPAGMSHAEYGRVLDVPGLDRDKPLGSVHLWHLIDDPRILHAMLTRGIRNWGPFESLVIKGGLRVDEIDPDTLGLIEDRTGVVGAVFAASRVGRGKALDREALEASGAISDAFIDRLVEVSASVGGDAARLIEALDSKDVARWRPDNTESLRGYFEEEGYLDPEKPLTREEIHHRALKEAIKSRPDVDLGEGWLDRVIDDLFVMHCSDSTARIAEFETGDL